MEEIPEKMYQERQADSDSTETLSPESTSRITSRSRKRPPKDGFHPILIQMHGIQRGARYRIAKEETVIGRSSSCEITLNDVGVSRRHTKVVWENWSRPQETPRCFVEDMGSRNGTELNGKLINRRVPLNERDRISLGRTTLVLAFRDEEEILHDEDLYQSATRDPLTGLDNRQQLSYVLRHLLSSSARRKMALSLLVIDIDRFKMINDTHGHAAGDEALRSLSETLLSCLRASDLAARWGGEEFVVILPNTPKGLAVEVAERIRQTVESQTVTCGEVKMRLTVSIGISEARHSDSVQSLFDRADYRLYAAKEGGRNRVCAFDKMANNQTETADT